MPAQVKAEPLLEKERQRKLRKEEKAERKKVRCGACLRATNRMLYEVMSCLVTI